MKIKILLFCMWVGLAGVAPAESILTLAPIADTFVRDGSYATVNYGSATVLNVKTNPSSGYNRNTFLKFDTSSASNVTGAKLRVFASLSIAGRVLVYGYCVPTTSWSESGMTWNNQPALGNALSSATVTSLSGTWVEFDVSSYVRAQRAAGNNVISIALKDPFPVDPLIGFPSREASSNQPQLVLTQAFVQTPVADAYVRDGSYANTNFGSDLSLYTKTDVTGYNRRAFLKFNVPSNTNPYRILTLRLYGGNSGTSTPIDAARYITNNSWQESTITWNNQPALDGEFVGANISNIQQYYNWDVTFAPTSFSQISFAIFMEAQPTTPSPDIYNSREAGSNPPQLVMSTSGDGSEPVAAPVLARNGYYYGTTFYGGRNDLGTIYRLSPEGALDILHSFTSSEGGNPYGRLIQGPDGLLYGTNQQYGTNGEGSIFHIATDGTNFSVVHTCSNATGARPNNGLVIGSDNNLYGTTNYGGSNNAGVVYRLTTAGAYTVLFTFDGTHGQSPNNLVAGTDRFLYGTTHNGGAQGSGTIFQISTSGQMTVEYSFPSSGSNLPQYGLTELNGVFYGSTSTGSYFSWKPGSSPQTIYTSTTGSASAELFAGGDGFLYGADNGNEMFKLSTSGQFTALLTFNGTNGSFPRGVVRASDGTIYGVTTYGGLGSGGVEQGYGLVYKYSSGSENVLHYFY
jgi:uncharacterized repeat protein (TIGR03803 family)